MKLGKNLEREKSSVSNTIKKRVEIKTNLSFLKNQRNETSTQNTIARFEISLLPTKTVMNFSIFGYFTKPNILHSIRIKRKRTTCFYKGSNTQPKEERVENTIPCQSKCQTCFYFFFDLLSKKKEEDVCG
jgi:hypothetical protein